MSYARKSMNVIWEFKMKDRHYKLNHYKLGLATAVVIYCLYTLSPANHCLLPRKWENIWSFAGSCSKYPGFSFSCKERNAIFRLFSNLTVQGLTKANPSAGPPLLLLLFFFLPTPNTDLLFPSQPQECRKGYLLNLT